MNNGKDYQIRYHLLKLLESNPNLTQRQMAKEMGLSLGKFNYCLTELVKKSFVKIDRYKSSDNKASYMYILTPQGIKAKTEITANFLKHKMNEYEKIKQEIEELKEEIVNETPENR